MVPVDEIGSRLARLRVGLQSAGFDAAVVVGITNLVYFSGTSQVAHLVVPADGEPALLVRRVLERARRESPLERIEPLPSLRGLPEALAAAGLRPGATLAFELDVLPAAAYLGYVRRLDGYALADCSRLVREVRARKSAWELERIRAAAAQVRAAVEALPALLRAGVTESELQAELERELRRAGHQGQLRFRGFNQEMHYGQVLAGPSAATAGYSDSPLCGPGPNVVIGKGADGHRLAPGDPVIVDLVGGHEGYVADQTRTFALAPLAADLRDAYGHARAILRAVEAEIRPGVAPSALWEGSLALAEEAGLGEHFMGHGPDRVRFLGHGIGLEIDELPVLAPGFDAPLEPGHVVAVEPKFVFPGRGAVGIEDTYAVTADGCERLTTAADELVEV
jgi:Xaa-Pro dipeptidase